MGMGLYAVLLNAFKDCHKNGMGLLFVESL
jgi:hypothetical protein